MYLYSQANVSAPLPLKLKEEKDEYNMINSNKPLLDENKLLNNEKESTGASNLIEIKEKESPESIKLEENLREIDEKIINEQVKSEDFIQEPLNEEFSDESKYTENVIIVRIVKWINSTYFFAKTKFILYFLFIIR